MTGSLSVPCGRWLTRSLDPVGTTGEREVGVRLSRDSL